MVTADTGASTLAARVVCRTIIPALALLVGGVLSALWHWGPQTLYFDILRFGGIDPFRFPFLDIHAVLAAAECHRQGVDVYLVNPCDALGRVHVYSPFWLVVTPAFFDTRATAWVGSSLDLLVILSLAAVLRPAKRGELLILGLAVLSPVTAYALERANCDLVVFLLVLWGSVLDRRPYPYRIGCYALYLLAGLLKYYPLVLLALVVRERRRDALWIVGLAGATVLLLAAADPVALAKALANIPRLSYFADSFSALNLPYGLAEELASPRHRPIGAVLLLGLLLAVAAARTRRTVALLDAAALGRTGAEAECLTVGALLLVACFLVAQNVDYRGIYLLLVMPGLIGLRRAAEDAAVRRFLTRTIAAVLFLAWEEFFRRGLHALAVMAPTGGLGVRTEALFWLGRELLWWWLIAGLAAIVLSQLSPAPLVGDARAGFSRLLRGRERPRAVEG
jgi:hypothetical protein